MCASKHDAITEFFDLREGFKQTSHSALWSIQVHVVALLHFLRGARQATQSVGLKHEFNSCFSPREMNITLFSTCYTYFIQSEFLRIFPINFAQFCKTVF